MKKKFVLVAAALVTSFGALAADGNSPMQAPEISVCSKGNLSPRTVSFEVLENTAVLHALHTESGKGTCWARLGDKGTDGYASGAVEVRKVGGTQHIDGLGDVMHYDIWVSQGHFSTRAGFADRFITTDAALLLDGDGTVVRAGMLSKAHPEASEILLSDGERLVIDGVVIAVGYKAPVLVDYNGGRKTYSMSKFTREELETIDHAVARLDGKERELVQSALSVSFE
ncbi:hypothetical protein [Scleromatobacter humisilvae]|uniref:Uncharacterized protein n=1 Tax=Scleromatobacter humisilvae TaxID=2897159 RepID=A0A9X2C0F8_9BURK|nr:hypothetical protein [Scleromatobacter humisilvae]MCK9687287.1 hypothetical protein [Scleromatobacter humisilvae]